MSSFANVYNLPSAKHKRNAGFSLLEMLGVIGILGILLSISIGYLRSDGIALRQATSGLSATLRSVRLEAVRRNQNVGILFEKANNRYRIYLDNDADRQFSTGDVVTQTLVLDENFRGVKLQGISVASSQTTTFNLVFDARGISRSGTVGQLTIGTNKENKRTLTINAQGKAVSQ